MGIKRVNLQEAKKEYKRKLAKLRGQPMAEFIKDEKNTTRAELRRLQRAKISEKLKKEPKYNNQHVEFAGIKFPSKLEANDYRTLLGREKLKEIKDIRCQHSIYLSAAQIEYRVDFSYIVCATGEREFFESKGLELDVFKLKKRLWKHYGPGRLRIHYGKGKYDEVIPDDQHMACRLCGR